MKVTVIGIFRRYGKSKKNGSAYDMCQLVTLKEIKPSSNESSTFMGVGYESSNMDADPALINQLSGARFPLELDVQFETVINDWGKAVSIVNAVKKVA